MENQVQSPPEKEGIFTALSLPPERFIVAARKALGWSRAELSCRAQVSVGTLSDFETGKRHPIPNNFRSIVRALGAARIDFLLADEEIIGVRWPKS